MRKWGMPLAVLVVVGGLIGIFILGDSASVAPEKPDSALSGQKHEEGSQTHIEPGAAHEPYNSDLPSSGPHLAPAAPWGVQDRPDVDERYVHNLEHGGIWLAYKPDLPVDQIQKIKDLAKSLPPSPQFNSVKVVITAREKNTKPIMLAAWGYTLNLDSFDEEAIKTFYSDHIDKGPELVP